MAKISYRLKKIISSGKATAKQYREYLKLKGYTGLSKLNKDDLIRLYTFDKKKVKDLRAIAKAKNIKGRSKMKKKELVKSVIKSRKVQPKLNDEMKAIVKDIRDLLINNVEDDVDIEMTDDKDQALKDVKIIFEAIKNNIDNLDDDDYVLLVEVNGNAWYTVSDLNQFYQDIIDIAEQGADAVYDETKSDGEIIEIVLKGQLASLKLIVKKRNKKIKEGAFFKYVHNMDFDFSKIGIYNKITDDGNCLINAIERQLLLNVKIEVRKPKYTDKELCRMAVKDGYILKKIWHGDYQRIDLKYENEIDNKYQEYITSEKVDLDKINIVINHLKTCVINKKIPRKNLEGISKKNNLHIILKTRLDNGDLKVQHYNKDGKYVINIGLIDDHYISIEELEITSFAIENYEEIKGIKRWNRIYRKLGDNKYKRSSYKYINSFKAVELLLKNKEKLLTKISKTHEIYKTDYSDEVMTITSLEYDEENCREVKYIESKENNYKVYFFDFETTTDGKHTPYLCCLSDDNGNVKTFKGEEAGIKMLRSLNQDSLLLAHNLGYDARFLKKYITTISSIEKGNKIMSLKGLFFNNNKKINIILKDTYSLISSPLKSFGPMFNIKTEKEVMPYKLYNKENVAKETVLISEAMKYLKGSDKDQFIENINKWNLKKGDKFDHLEYAKIYCEIDCKVLREGYNKFREMIKEVCGLDCNSIISSASLADRYFIKQGCYDGVYELSGVPREFIQKCVVGGRVMTCENAMFHVMDILNDFDAVSLYPSAMYRLEGFLKGKPKVLKSTDYDTIKTYDGYFIEIKITKVGKYRKFPLASVLDDKGTRVFTNDLVGKVLHVDKIALEDLIKYQKVQFEIIRGYYFNDGFNNKIKETIKHLFDARLSAKKENNPIQAIYKLIMNSGYGKSIMKPVDTDKKTFNSKDKALDYIIRNFNKIKYMIKLDGCDKYVVKTSKPIVNHFSRPQVGVSILSMSKRIMNEVITLAEDINIDIYYQDTDSMHITAKDIPKLAKEYKKIHNRELIGKNLGQFHSDFDFDSDEEPVSVESYFLGKKAYIDKVKIVKEGKVNYDYHIRMKGVPKSAILDINDNPMDTYKRLFTNEKIEFNLLAGDKVNFKFNKDYSITTNEHFTRKVKYENKDKRVIKA